MKKSIYCIVVISFLILQSVTAQTSFSVKVSGKGQPIIFIPGYSCSGEVWNETVEHLKDRYQCHVLKLAGFAGVPRIDAPILRTVKDDIIRYIKDRKLQKPIIIGHSLGGFMGLWISSDQPALLDKLVCVDGVPFVSALNNPNANAEQLKKDPMFNAEAVAKNFESLPDSGFIDRTAKAMQWQVSDTARARQIATWQYKSDRRTLGLTLVEMSTTDLRNAIKTIKHPLLVLGSIYGTKDNSTKLLAQQFQNTPQAVIEVADSKHFIMYDQPEWMYEKIESFLKK